MVLVVDARDVLADLGERQAAIAAHLDVAIVGAGPEDAGDDGRLGEFRNRAELVLDIAVVLREDARLAAIGVGTTAAPAAATRQGIRLFEDRATVEIDVLAERVGDDPTLTAVARDEQLTASEEHRAGVVRREPDRRVPIELLNRALFRRVDHVAPAAPPAALAAACLRTARGAGASGLCRGLTAPAASTTRTTASTAAARQEQDVRVCTWPVLRL